MLLWAWNPSLSLHHPRSRPGQAPRAPSGERPAIRGSRSLSWLHSRRGVRMRFGPVRDRHAKVDWLGNSLRTRTKLATDGSPDILALAPACKKSGVSVRLERPRATSKSGLNGGCFGTSVSAAAISFWSAADGVHTFRTFTFTGGCCESTGNEPAIRQSAATIFGRKAFPDTTAILMTAVHQRLASRTQEPANPRSR